MNWREDKGEYDIFNTYILLPHHETCKPLQCLGPRRLIVERKDSVTNLRVLDNHFSVSGETSIGFKNKGK